MLVNDHLVHINDLSLAEFGPPAVYHELHPEDLMIRVESVQAGLRARIACPTGATELTSKTPGIG